MANIQWCRYCGSPVTENMLSHLIQAHELSNLDRSDRRRVIQSYLDGQTTISRRTALTAAGVSVLGSVVITGAASGQTQNIITDWNDLDAVRNDLAGNYLLEADLDADSPGYDAHVSGPAQGFDPIGDGTDPFMGTLNGQGNSIQDLTIDRENEDAIGLFGAVATDGVVQNLELENVDITGGSRVGGIAGVNQGSLERSCVTGQILTPPSTTDQSCPECTAPDPGTDDFDLTIENIDTSNFPSVETTVRADTQAARDGNLTANNFEICEETVDGFGNGFCGQTIDTVTFAGGQGAEDADVLITFDTSDSMTFEQGKFENAKDGAKTLVDNLGDNVNVGLVEFKTTAELVASLGTSQATVKNEIDNLSSSGSTNMSDGIEISQQELANNSDSNTPNFIVILADGEPNEGGATRTQADVAKNAGTTVISIAYGSDANEELMLDIASPPKNGNDPTQIQDGDENAFVGEQDNISQVFEDIGDIISGTYNIEYETTNPVTNNTQRNVRVYVADPDEGDTDTTGSYTAPSDTQDPSDSPEQTGGLVGQNSGDITEAFAAVSVTGTDAVGGLTGTNSGSLTDTYALSMVTGESAVGGLSGTVDGQNGSIESSYAAGNLTGPSGEVGGLVAGGSGVTNSYWDEDTTGQTSSSGGGIGLATDQMQGVTPTPDGNNTMAGLDFAREEATDDTWVAVINGEDIGQIPNRDGYPILDSIDTEKQLDAQEIGVGGGDDATGPGDFQIIEVTAPSEVSPTEEFSVQFVVKNFGQEDRKSIRLEIDGSVVDSRGHTLTPDQSIKNSFVGVSVFSRFDPGDTVDIAVRTEDDIVVRSLTIVSDRTISDYANEDDIIDTSGVLAAINDWRSNEIGVALLLSVISAWRSGDPVS